MARGIDKSYIERKGIERDDLVEVTDLKTGRSYPGYFHGFSKRFLHIAVPDPDSGMLGLPDYTTCNLDRGRDIEVELVRKFRGE